MKLFSDSLIFEIHIVVRLCVWSLIWLLWGIEVSVEGIGELGFWFEKIKSHVLWCWGVGSLAHCCPNCLSSMLILSHSWGVHGDSCRDSRFSDESRILLRFLDAYRRNGHGLVRHCFVWSQCACRVRNLGHNFFPLIVLCLISEKLEENKIVAL